MDHLVAQYFEECFPACVTVPIAVGEDDAIRSVREQFADAGFGRSEEMARGLVHEAWSTTGE